MKNHIHYINKCLDLARVAKRNGKTAVGSLLVKNDEIISEGIEGTASFPQLLAHAEVVAITRAIETLGSKDLSDCILYTTVEPCFMCSFLIRETKIREVVFGVNAGPIGGVSSNYPILLAGDIARWQVTPKITQGVMHKACMDLLVS